MRKNLTKKERLILKILIHDLRDLKGLFAKEIKEFNNLTEEDSEDE